jgi:acyl-CoA reductase-like NAD-dependent aldehyde dehydrogenase
MTDLKTSTTAVTPTPKVYECFIGGAWDSGCSSTFDDYEPYSGEVFAQAPACGRDEARRAVEAAAAAFPAWAETPAAERARLFLRAAEILERRHDEIVRMLIRETGSTVLFANFQLQGTKQELQQAANWVYLPKGDILQSDLPGTYSTAVRRPLGVVASFAPWNAASVLSWRVVLSPLAAGNTVVLKPSELAPVCAGLLVAEIVDEAGFPPGVVNVVTHAPGAAGPIADEFFDNPAVRCINFIGSLRTARIVAERAGRALKRSVMELGGYNPLIILNDVDIDYAVRVAVFSAFLHQGQICMNARKIIVQRAIYDDFVERFADKARTLPLGDPELPETMIGPLITPDAVTAVDERVAEAITMGAQVLTGGSSSGQIYEPTILVDVPTSAAVSCEETFGPVVVVQAVESAEEAIDVANQENGLSSAILSGDTYRAFELAARLRSGAVHINMPTIDDEIQAPIGGVGDSGWGRTGPYSVNDFTDLIWINVQSGQRQLPIE